MSSDLDPSPEYNDRCAMRKGSSASGTTELPEGSLIISCAIIGGVSGRRDRFASPNSAVRTGCWTTRRSYVLVCGSAKREETCIRGCRRTNGLAVGRVRSEKDAWLVAGLRLLLEPTEEKITELNEDCGDECPLLGEDGVVV